MNAVYETATGRLVSVGTVVANPLPAGLTSVALSAADRDGLRDGTRVWDATMRAVVARTPTPEEINKPTIEALIDSALVDLDTLIAAPAVATVPAGTLTVTQLSNAMREMRDAVQANRAGAQQIARQLKRTIRLVRGDFDDVN
jgi:hypothetical protein